MRPTFTATDIFGSRGRVDVLRILWGVDAPLTAAEVARRARMTHPAASAILRSLSVQGVVASSPAGRGYTYWMLRDNSYVEEFLTPVFSAERRMPEMMLGAIAQELETLTVSVVLFGSYARGEQDADSDVDIAIVVEDEAAKARLERAYGPIAYGFERRFGAALSALVYDRREAAELVSRSPSLWESIRHDALTAYGMSVDEWARDESRR